MRRPILILILVALAAIAGVTIRARFLRAKNAASSLPDSMTNKVRIYLDSVNVKGWNEIDAVGLIDTAGVTQWAISADASSNYPSGTRAASFSDATVARRTEWTCRLAFPVGNDAEYSNALQAVLTPRGSTISTVPGGISGVYSLGPTYSAPMQSLVITSSGGGRNIASWDVLQATGPPDTPGSGDISTAWASATQDGQKEWLELTYAKHVDPATLEIHETYNPGALYKVSVFTPTGKERVVWKGSDPTPITAARGVSKIPLR